MDLSKPLPLPTPQTQPFWDAAREHRLVAPRCADCGTTFLYPAPTCPTCLGESFGWEQLSGRGVVYSCTVVRQALHPAFRAEVPYVFAIIELEEGMRMASNVIECDPEEVHPDQPVEVVFEEASETITLPKFRPVTAAR